MIVTPALLFGQQPYPAPPGYPQQGYPPPNDAQQGYPQPGYGPPQPGYPPQQPAPPDAEGVPDQPGQPVARLGAISGEASVRRGDSDEWIAAALNTPLMAGDSVSVAPGGSAEVQLDYGNFVRLAGDTEIRISALENGRNQIQLARGMIMFRVLHDSSTQSEISTADAAIHPGRLSSVRVEVGPDGATRVVARHGDDDVLNPGGSQHLREGNMMIVRGSPDTAQAQVVSAPPRDSWDSWSDQRDAYIQKAPSNRYLSPEVTGGEDLDAYGRWGYDPAYGNVWTPAVPATWAPYREGQWVWEDFYGWTWVDSAPWGWAPFHYGTWYFRTGFGWTWFPGSRTAHYWWHPAMVSFFGFGVGGSFGVGFGFGNVGWVSLAPFEIFHPWYGRGWYGSGGAFVTGHVWTVNNFNVINTYRNARIANGVTAVTAQDFQRGVFRNPVGVGNAELARVSLVRGAVPVSPTASNLRFSNRAVSTATPRAAITNQRFFSRMQVSTPVRTPFAQQQAATRSAFGARNYAPAQSAPRTSYRSAPPAASGGWRSFGEPPGRHSEGAQVQRPGGDWNQFGRPQSAPQRSPSYSRPAYGSGNYGAPQTPAYRRSGPSPSPAPSRAPEVRSAPGNRNSGGSSGGANGHAPRR